MGICTTCPSAHPGFIYVDEQTRKRLPNDVTYVGSCEQHKLKALLGRDCPDCAALDYKGTIATEPCPECNPGRRRVFLAAPELMAEKADRAGYPSVWEGEREPVSWMPYQRGGARPQSRHLKIVKQEKLAAFEQALDTATRPPSE